MSKEFKQKSKNKNRSSIGVYLLLGIILCLITSVYLIGGTLGIYAWNFALFILSPIGVVGSIISFILLVMRIAKRKKLNIIFKYQITFLLLSFPILLLLGVVSIPYPAINIDDSKEIVIENPIGKDAVLFGGKEYKTHAVWPSERYAYDILVKPYEVGSSKLEDYGIFGREVFAPTKGKIIDIHDGEEDIEPNTEEFTSSLGNYIFMQVEETGTYLIFAHLKQDSICVNIGDSIDAGTVIGQVGNSGTTSEPHLHLQHQKNNPMKMKIPICAEGLPINFK